MKSLELPDFHLILRGIRQRINTTSPLVFARTNSRQQHAGAQATAYWRLTPSFQSINILSTTNTASAWDISSLKSHFYGSVWDGGPYTSFRMLEYLIDKYTERSHPQRHIRDFLDNATIIKRVSVMEMEKDTMDDSGALHPLFAEETGLCTSFSINVARLLTDGDPEVAGALDAKGCCLIAGGPIKGYCSIGRLGHRRRKGARVVLNLDSVIIYHDLTYL